MAIWALSCDHCCKWVLWFKVGSHSWFLIVPTSELECYSFISAVLEQQFSFAYQLEVCTWTCISVSLPSLPFSLCVKWVSWLKANNLSSSAHKCYFHQTAIWEQQFFFGHQLLEVCPWKCSSTYLLALYPHFLCQLATMHLFVVDRSGTIALTWSITL